MKDRKNSGSATERATQRAVACLSAFRLAVGDEMPRLLRHGRSFLKLSESSLNRNVVCENNAYLQLGYVTGHLYCPHLKA